MATSSQPVRASVPSSGIRVAAVGVEYAGRKGTVRALSDLSLDVEAGEFVAIVGRSGCGKSTLLRVVGGLIAPTEGVVWLSGAHVDEPPAATRFVPQNYTQSLLPWLTVESNVAFGVRHAVRTVTNPTEAVARVLDLVGLSHARARYPRELSGGMQQRVAIARAIASRPEVLLLDEAFSSVDALSRAKLQDMILDLWSRLGFTAILVTHDIDEAIYLADRVVVIEASGSGVAASVTIDLPRPRHQVETRELQRYLDYRRLLIDRVLSPDAPGMAST